MYTDSRTRCFNWTGPHAHVYLHIVMMRYSLHASVYCIVHARVYLCNTSVFLTFSRYRGQLAHNSVEIIVFSACSTYSYIRTPDTSYNMVGGGKKSMNKTTVRRDKFENCSDRRFKNKKNTLFMHTHRCCQLIFVSFRFFLHFLSLLRFVYASEYVRARTRITGINTYSTMSIKTNIVIYYTYRYVRFGGANQTREIMLFTIPNATKAKVMRKKNHTHAQRIRVAINIIYNDEKKKISKMIKLADVFN